MQSVILIHSTISVSSCQAGYFNFHVFSSGEGVPEVQINLTKNKGIVKAKV